MVFLGFGFGVTKETWFPDTEDTGAEYELPQGLTPLARHKADFTVVQGCSNQFSNEAHWGSTFWLTGANRFAVAGQSMSNSISVAERDLWWANSNLLGAAVIHSSCDRLRKILETVTTAGCANTIDKLTLFCSAEIPLRACYFNINVEFDESI